jgi:hypothetical protein
VETQDAFDMVCVQQALGALQMSLRMTGSVNYEYTSRENFECI